MKNFVGFISLSHYILHMNELRELYKFNLNLQHYFQGYVGKNV